MNLCIFTYTYTIHNTHTYTYIITVIPFFPMYIFSTLAQMVIFWMPWNACNDQNDQNDLNERYDRNDRNNQMTGMTRWPEGRKERKTRMTRWQEWQEWPEWPDDRMTAMTGWPQWPDDRNDRMAGITGWPDNRDDRMNRMTEMNGMAGMTRILEWLKLLRLWGSPKWPEYLDVSSEAICFLNHLHCMVQVHRYRKLASFVFLHPCILKFPWNLSTGGQCFIPFYRRN